MIDFGSNKGFKADSTFIYLLFYFICKGMKRKFDYYVGIDVSKLTLDVTVLYECNDTSKTEYYRLGNSEKSIARFVKKKLGSYLPEQTLFCFEDTGIYSLPLSCYLNDNKLSYWQVPSMEIKRSKGITQGKKRQN